MKLFAAAVAAPMVVSTATAAAVATGSQRDVIAAIGLNGGRCNSVGRGAQASQ